MKTTTMSEMTSETHSFFLSGAAGVALTGSGRCSGDYLEVPAGDHRANMSCGVSGRNIFFPFIGEFGFCVGRTRCI